ncbi:hypothetical protein RND81_10G034100 [Saponaria officinalis]|uniref:Uncharacterized protein n=1 Tax=Saponaria officinalis TaxID=3572 RepID=A0AAW1HXH8_SAPOF
MEQHKKLGLFLSIPVELAVSLILSHGIKKLTDGAEEQCSAMKLMQQYDAQHSNDGHNGLGKQKAHKGKDRPPQETSKMTAHEECQLKRSHKNSVAANY